MQETIDLIAHRELRNLRKFTRETGQPTTIEQLDLEPMTNVQNIEIDEEHITIKYNEKIERHYNANAITTANGCTSTTTIPRWSPPCAR